MKDTDRQRQTDTDRQHHRHCVLCIAPHPLRDLSSFRSPRRPVCGMAACTSPTLPKRRPRHKQRHMGLSPTNGLTDWAVCRRTATHDEPNHWRLRPLTSSEPWHFCVSPRRSSASLGSTQRRETTQHQTLSGQTETQTRRDREKGFHAPAQKVRRALDACQNQMVTHIQAAKNFRGPDSQGSSQQKQREPRWAGS